MSDWLEFAESDWGVGKAADKLSRSLFAHSPKSETRRPAKKESSIFQANKLAFCNQNDSDEEKMSRKEKKHLKEKERKKRKKHGGSQVYDSGTRNVPSSAGHSDRQQKNSASPKKTKKSDAIPVHDRDASVGAKYSKGDHHSSHISRQGSIEVDMDSNISITPKKRKKSKSDVSDSNHKEVQHASGNTKMAKKRKLKDLQTVGAFDEGLLQKTTKKAKLKLLNSKDPEEIHSQGQNSIGATSAASDSHSPKKKRRRSRKKKNNSKKNKYKHLALNKQSAEAVSGEDASTKEKLASSLSDSSNDNKSAVAGSAKGEKTTIPLKSSKGKEKKRKQNSDGPDFNSDLQVPSPKKGKCPEANSRKLSEVQMKPSASSQKGRKGTHQVKGHSDYSRDSSSFPDFGEDANVDYDRSSSSEPELDSASESDTKSSEDAGSATEQSHRKTSSNPAVTIKDTAAIKPKDNKPQKAMTLADKAREKLNSARFRFLNEQLYTSSGHEALKMFEKDREAFEVYHQGYQAQVSRWPLNPLDVIIQQLGNKPGCKAIADFGCGDAHLAETLTDKKVHSFDLVALKPCVTACDIAKVPLPAGCVDAAVFCLSLMGTNLADYLCEANRVLKKGGLMKVAEVVSRFDNVNTFVSKVEKLGFQLLKKTMLSKMFYLFTFRKFKDAQRKQVPSIELKPCFYKRR